MSGQMMVLPTPDGRWEVLEGVAVIAVCDAPEKAARVADALETKDTVVKALQARVEELAGDVADLDLDFMDAEGDEDLRALEGRVRDARQEAHVLQAEVNGLVSTARVAPSSGA